MAFVPFTATALGQRITIKLDQADLEEVLDVVRQKMGYMFVYNNQMVKDAGKISVDVTSDDVNYILKKCLEGTSLDFYVEDNIVVIVTKSGQVVRDADKKVVTVKGKVVDDKKQPLPGVTVLLKGTSFGVTTFLSASRTT